MKRSYKRKCSGCLALRRGAPTYCELEVPIMIRVPKYPEPFDSSEYEPLAPCYKPTTTDELVQVVKIQT